MDNKINIDFSNRYTFGQALDMLNENSSLSFVSKGYLYFLKDNALKSCKITNGEMTKSTLQCMDVDKPILLINDTFYKCDYYISKIVSEISIDKVKEFLFMGYLIMFVVEENTWIISLEDDAIFLDYEQVKNATIENYESIFLDDFCYGLLYGKWFAINRDFQGGELYV